MLTLEKSKVLLGDTSISDEEVEALRSALYDSVQLASEVYKNDKDSGSKNPLGLLGALELKDTV